MEASLLAMDVNDNAPCLDDRVVRALIASRLAPTMGSWTRQQKYRGSYQPKPRDRLICWR
ncbi:hypothetical protein F6476_11210 [Pseudomonas umsongensis]|nr:hypothetical protein F6476_11210 [Pseudomonas umsongensis]